MPRRKPFVFPRGWRELARPDDPCRQKTGQCDLHGECLRCFAANGESCLDVPPKTKEHQS